MIIQNSVKSSSFDEHKNREGSETFVGETRKIIQASSSQMILFFSLSFFCEIFIHVFVFKYEALRSDGDNTPFGCSTKLLRFKLVNCGILLLLIFSLIHFSNIPFQKTKESYINRKNLFAYFFMSNLLCNSLTYHLLINNATFDNEFHESSLQKDNLIMIILFIVDLFMGGIFSEIDHDIEYQKHNLYFEFRYSFAVSNLGEIGLYVLNGAFSSWVSILVLVALNITMVILSVQFANKIKRSPFGLYLNFSNINNESDKPADKLIQTIKNIIHINIDKEVRNSGDIFTKLSNLKKIGNKNKAESEFMKVISDKMPSSQGPPRKDNDFFEDDKACDNLGDLEPEEIDEILKKLAVIENLSIKESDNSDLIEASKKIRDQFKSEVLDSIDDPKITSGSQLHLINPKSRFIGKSSFTFEWSTDFFELQRDGSPVIVEVGFDILEKLRIEEALSIQDPLIVKNFLQQLQCIYKEVHYHNAFHAVDVANSMACFLGTGWFEKLSDLEVVCIVITGLAHDLGHPGFNNSHLVQTKNELAMTYNDKNVLENMHCALLFNILKEEKCDILKGLDSKRAKIFRKQTISMILDTDMQKHNELLEEWFRIYSKGENSYENSRFKELSMSVAIKCADLGHGTKDLEVHKKWTRLLIEEFYHQGDVEKELEINISPMCNRLINTYAKSQEGFLKHIVTPLYEKWLRFLDCQEFSEKLMSELQKNIEYWSIHDFQPEDKNLLFTQTEEFWKKFNKIALKND